VTTGNAAVVGTAQFDANLNVIMVTPLTMGIQGNESLLFDASSLDFTQFTSGSLVFTFNVANGGVTFPQIFAHAAGLSGGGTLTLAGSGSFSQSNVPLGVPEPFSVAAWCIVGAIAFGYGLRLRKRR
jgi:hypothetical protein